MMSNYLVTGAAGFIGSAIAKKMISEGNKVVTIDNLSTGSLENIPNECEFLQGNIYNEEVVQKLYNYKFDAIIHIAGQSSGEISFENPVYDLQTNTQSTIMLLDYCLKTECKNFIYASSMSVYGDAECEFVNELTPQIPKSFYAVGKKASEDYMRIYSKLGIKCTALRFFNVYGVGQNMENLKQGMASIYLAMAINDGHITVKGSKDRFRDFIYIDDVVNATIGSINRTKGGEFEVYNVSTSIKTKVNQVIAEIKKNLNDDIRVEYTSSTPGDQKGVYGDNSKLRKDISWEPITDFSTGIAKMVKWALERKK